MKVAVFLAAASAVSALDLTRSVHDEAEVSRVQSLAKTWQAGKNDRFEGATLGDASRLMGALIKTPAFHRKRASAPESDLTALPIEALPTEFNATANWPQCANVIGHVRDQSDCGCCWAFGSTEAFNDRMCINHNVTTLMSVQQTCSCVGGSSDGCNGGFLEDAWTSFVSNGVVTGGDAPSIGSGDSCFPYQLAMCNHHEGGPYQNCTSMCGGNDCATPQCPSNKCSEKTYPTPYANDLHYAKTWYGVTGVSKIMTEIYTRGPVGATFNVYSDFLLYKSGVYKQTPGSSDLGGHAIKIIGWGAENGENYWLVANSWNNNWGDFGFFKIARGIDECGIEDDVVAGTV